MELENDKIYYWTFTIDSQGIVQQSVSPIEAKKFHNIRHYFNDVDDDACQMIVNAGEPIHWIFKRPTETIYCFRNRNEAEEFIHKSVIDSLYKK
jgi:hypothetical protein